MTEVDDQATAVERNKAVVRRIFDEIFNQGKLEVADELLTHNTAVHVPFEHPGSGPAALKKIVASLRGGFPDIQLEIEDLLGEGDKIAVAWHSTRQTHLGPYRGLPPTRRSIQVSGIDILRFDDGRVAEFSMHLDELGAVRQMGVVPPEGVSSAYRVAFVLGSLFRFAFLEARHGLGKARRRKALPGEGS
jgi:predicted ester cyclase